MRIPVSFSLSCGKLSNWGMITIFSFFFFFPSRRLWWMFRLSFSSRHCCTHSPGPPLCSNLACHSGPCLLAHMYVYIAAAGLFFFFSFSLCCRLGICLLPFRELLLLPLLSFRYYQIGNLLCGRQHSTSERRTGINPARHGTARGEGESRASGA